MLAADKNNDLLLIGWREWIALPELGITRVKAKIDTGARTSALHAFSMTTFEENGKPKIHFKIHPRQHNEEIVVNCMTDIIDERSVMDSGGHKEIRYVIQTPITLGTHTWVIEITLTNRDTMGFRMLLGRTAMRQRVLVDPSRSFLTKHKKGSPQK